MAQLADIPFRVERDHALVLTYSPSTHLRDKISYGGVLTAALDEFKWLYGCLRKRGVLERLNQCGRSPINGDQ